MMPLDHLVVLARTLEEGAAWVRERLGVEAGPGGRHDIMATHNRLLSLGEREYLEIMSIDPEAGAPSRPRWFGLDEPATRERIAGGPALVHWAVRSANLEHDIAKQDEPLEIVAFTRGQYSWRMALRPDGALPARGTRPTMIQWESAHPALALADAGCRLVDLGGPRANGEVRIATPHGIRTLPWTLGQPAE